MFCSHTAKYLKSTLIDDKGYLYCYYPEHPNAKHNGCVRIHRLVMENKICRYLNNGEQVHHKDADKLNNDPYNLELMTASEHSALHKGGFVGSIVCPGCNKSFYPHSNLRVYCSTECSYKHKEKTVWPTKEDLEILVWKNPTTHIAKELGVSDKAVEKRCKKYGIEKPPRGYWTKKIYSK